MRINAEKTPIQMEYGSPAQIWEELRQLAMAIFGINSAREFADRFEELNVTVLTSDGVSDVPGLKSPSAEWDLLTNIPHTTHHTMIE